MKSEAGGNSLQEKERREKRGNGIKRKEKQQTCKSIGNDLSQLQFHEAINNEFVVKVRSLSLEYKNEFYHGMCYVLETDYCLACEEDKGSEQVWSL